MTLIDTVRKLQQQGVEDKEIAGMLREKGYSPKEVINAISQSKIKAAVEGNSVEQYPQEQVAYPQQQQYSQEQAAYPPQQYPQQQYPPQDYSQQGYAYSPSAYPQESTESLKEIAEEVTEEKIGELREKISSLSSSKKEYESAMQDVERRLKQLEASFTQLQSAILGKIADYSKDLRSMTDEMHSTQEVFKKVLNPVVEKVRAKAKKRK